MLVPEPQWLEEGEKHRSYLSRLDKTRKKRDDDTQVGTKPKEIAKEKQKFDQNVDASSFCGTMWILEAAVALGKSPGPNLSGPTGEICCRSE